MKIKVLLTSKSLESSTSKFSQVVVKDGKGIKPIDTSPANERGRNKPLKSTLTVTFKQFDPPERFVK